MSWATVPGFPGYLVSEEGDVMSFKRYKEGRLLSKVDRDGYDAVTLSKAGKRGMLYQVHSLVLQAFVGPRPDGMQGLHEDGNKKNNRLSNLRWGTQADNEKDKIALGRDNRGERHGSSTLTEAQVREIIDAIPTWKRGMGAEFARKFGVTRMQVNMIRRREAWSHL